MRPQLIEARKIKRMTQRELGEAVGLSKQAICALERGRMNTRPDTWDALEAALGVDQKKLRRQSPLVTYRHDSTIHEK
jgi:DNA-binding XRE family transcriptional regulator